LEREEKTIYMGHIRAGSLKRSNIRLSEQPGNLPLSIEELPRGPYLLKFDELRSSEL
jgi:hypothetical protein